MTTVVVDQDHTSSSDDLSNQDCRCCSKDCIIVVSVAAVMDQDHTSSSNDLSNQDYRCWSKDYIVVVEV